jgi:hypothetical protein
VVSEINDPNLDRAVDLLLLDRAEWRAWALSLKRAGHFRRPGTDPE